MQRTQIGAGPAFMAAARLIRDFQLPQSRREEWGWDGQGRIALLELSEHYQCKRLIAFET